MESLLDIRADLAALKNIAAAHYMACDAHSMPGERRAALCEARNNVRQRPDVILIARSDASQAFRA